MSDPRGRTGAALGGDGAGTARTDGGEVAGDGPPLTDAGATGKTRDADEPRDPVEVPDPEDLPDASWRRRDKLAGLGVVALCTGYLHEPVRNGIGHGMDLLLGGATAVLPFFLVVLGTGATSGLLSALLTWHLLDPEKVSRCEARIDGLHEKKRRAKERGDEEAVSELQTRQLKAIVDLKPIFKLHFRPTAWIALAVIPLVLWLRFKLYVRGFADVEAVLPLVGRASLGEGVVGATQAWLVLYLVAVFGSSQLFRKLLGVRT